MYFTLRMFRVLLLGCVILLCLSVLGIAGYLAPHFEEQSAVVVLILLPITTTLGALWSIHRKQLMRTEQTVLCELLLAFFATPCHLVLCLYVVMLRRYVRPQDIPVVVALEAIVFTLSLATLLYALGLLITSTFTFFTFDSSVWVRNIDSSPSPFPAPIVFAPVLKILGLKPPADASASMTSPTMSNGNGNGHSAICTGSGGCSCSTRSKSTSVLAPVESRSSAEAESGLSVAGEKSTPGSSLHSSSVLDLIKVPDAAQKRQSIMVAFDDV